MNNQIAHILIVDDDDGIRKLVKQYLSENNFLVSTANSAEDAEKKIELFKFDLIVLDIMMPGKSGIEFISENKKKIQTPIILLTAKGEPADRIQGLEIGADDYLPKPFEPKELTLRIESILNRIEKKHKKFVEFSSVKIDLDKLYIIKDKEEYKINNAEQIILQRMINAPGIILSRDEISNLINVDKERSIDVIITRLRKKIENDPKNPKYLQTVRGEGYVLWIE